LWLLGLQRFNARPPLLSFVVRPQRALRKEVMRKKPLNLMEQQTDAVLQEAAQRHSVRVFAKPRVADVLPIDNSGISNELYSFALKSHFDFVVAGADLTGLFVVEFDGPAHQDEVQRQRDTKKGQLCDRFRLPILRIGAEHVNHRYRNLHLLTWFIEVWFALEAFEEAQASGQLPPDEPFDPWFFVTIPGLQGRFPLWLSAEPRSKLQRLWQQGKCLDFAPAKIVGGYGGDTLHAFGCIRLNEAEGVWTRTSLRNQAFPASSFELVQELVAFQVFDKVQDVVEGVDAPTAIPEIRRAATEFAAEVQRPIHTGWLAG
jgi:hypothetical protein